jgi:hypothetical protein
MIVSSKRLGNCQVIIHVNVELKTSVSEISIIRIDVMIDHTSLIYIPVHQIDASSCWCIVQ